MGMGRAAHVCARGHARGVAGGPHLPDKRRDPNAATKALFLSKSLLAYRASESNVAKVSP